MYNLQQPKISISNIFVLLSLLGTIAIFRFSNADMFGINHIFLEQERYSMVLLQFIAANFLHGGWMHFGFNAIFIYYFGNLVESIIGQQKYILFFLFCSIFTGIFVLFFSDAYTTTIGISGFCMALMAFYTLELRDKKNPEWTGGVTALVINVAIGFSSTISLSGHLFGAISGVIFYLLYRQWMKKKLIGMFV